MGGCSVDSAVAGCGHACVGCMRVFGGPEVDVGESNGLMDKVKPYVD